MTCTKSQHSFGFGQLHQYCTPKKQRNTISPAQSPILALNPYTCQTSNSIPNLTITTLSLPFSAKYSIHKQNQKMRKPDEIIPNLKFQNPETDQIHIPSNGDHAPSQDCCFSE